MLSQKTGYLRQRPFSSDGMVASLSNKIMSKTELPRKEDYPLLSYLCTDDTECRDIFGLSLKGSTSLSQKEEEKMGFYIKASLIGVSCLIELVLFHDKTNSLMPTKYQMIHALGELLNMIVPKAKNTDELKEVYSAVLSQLDKMRILKNKFLKNFSAQEIYVVETGLERHHLPPRLKDLILRNGLNDQYDMQNKFLKETRVKYKTALEKHKVLSCKLSKISDNPMDAKARKKFLGKLLNIEADYHRIFFTNYEIFTESRQLVFCEDFGYVSAIQTANKEFADMVGIKISSGSPNFYQNILNSKKQLAPLRNTDIKFFFRKDNKDNFSEGFEIKKFIASIWIDKVCEIEEAILMKLQKDLTDEVPGSDTPELRTKLLIFFKEAKRKMIIEEDCLYVIPSWSEDRSQNPFLLALDRVKSLSAFDCAVKQSDSDLTKDLLSLHDFLPSNDKNTPNQSTCDFSGTQVDCNSQSDEKIFSSRHAKTFGFFKYLKYSGKESAKEAKQEGQKPTEVPKLPGFRQEQS